MAALSQMPTQAFNADFFFNTVQPSPYCQPFQQVRPSATEARKVPFHSDVSFGSQAALVVPHDGDLLVGAVLEVRLRKRSNEFPTSVAAYYPVEALCKRVCLSVGGTVVDTHTPEWFRLYDEYVRTAEESQNYRRAANFDPDTLTTAVETTETLHLPMVFSFFRDRRSALPLASLPGCEVRFTLDFATADDVGVDPTVFEAAMYLDYGLVDPGVRQWLAGNPVSLLVEQVQWNGGQLVDPAKDDSHVNIRARLGFKRPVKALFWAMAEHDAQVPNRTMHARWVGDPAGTYLALQPSQNDFGGYNLIQSISEKLAPVWRAKLLFDGRERFPLRNAIYLHRVQSLRACKRAPLPGSYLYAFSDNIPSMQPTPGLCNFSKFRDIQLLVQLKKNTTAAVTDPVGFAGDRAEECAKNITGLRLLHVFAWSYNICIIHAGRFQMALTD